MLVSTYAEFGKNSNLFTLEENREICSKFNHFSLSNFMTPKEIESMVVAMYAPKFFGPYLLGTGFDEHSAALLFAGNYALFCDQSGISTEPGISVFHIPNRELVTENFIKEFSERADIKEEDYKIAEKFITSLGATLVHHEPLPAQIAGNCTYTSMQTALFALKGIAHVIKFFQGNKESLQNQIDKEVWRKFEQYVPNMKQWIKFDKKLVVDDFLNEIEEWLSNPTEFGRHPLGRTYHDTLTCWINTHEKQSQGICDQATIERVENLLKMF